MRSVTVIINWSICWVSAAGNSPLDGLDVKCLDTVIATSQPSDLGLETGHRLININDPSSSINANNYFHRFSELSFSRTNESTTGYTFTSCVGSFISPGIDTRQK